MQQISAQYDLDQSDYEWAVAALDDPTMQRGLYGAADTAVRAEFKLFLWVPALLLLVLMAVVAVVAAFQFGVLSLITLAAVLLVPVVPALWLAGAWLWDRFETLGVSGPPAKAMQQTLLKQLEKGKLPFPLGSIEMRSDENALHISGGGNAVEVHWHKGPIVHREGDRVLVMPFLKLGMPDVGRMAIVRSDGFADTEAFEHTIADWTSHAGR